jgi:hypothetical protein
VPATTPVVQKQNRGECARFRENAIRAFGFCTTGEIMEAPPKAPRQHTPEDIDSAIACHGRRVRRVQIWRLASRERPAVWIHLGRYGPSRDQLRRIQRNFGGGHYRVKLLGPWLPVARREAFIQQVSFTLSGPPTDLALRRVAAWKLRHTGP